ncbi:MAG: hypothetical protein O3C22_07645 [Bacteroidetes bacterium]|nr:hypothetical protein [Bacteroidota bacterium]MDA0943599.1 hypothetical protein [Bacteroidota bacterium]MDA1111780.1 hypothetical protein [Bacteroidota bacterium]
MKLLRRIAPHSFLSFIAVVLFAVCGCDSIESGTEKNESETMMIADSQRVEDGVKPNEQEKPVEKVMPRYNYEGAISGIPIRAQIEYGKVEHYGEFEEKWECRVTGYYYYNKIGSPIPLYGSCNSFGRIDFYCSLDGESESFEGSFDGGMFSDFVGTWQNDKKSLSFHLRSIEK